MDAASLSVIFTGSVALGGLVLNYMTGREQRTHERQQAFEARVWELKSDGLLNVITECRYLVDMIESPHLRDTLPIRIADALERLDEKLPVVETYGSDECRAAMDALHALLAEQDVNVVWTGRVETIREAKMAAIDAQDFEAAAAERNRERGALEAAAQEMNASPDEVMSRAKQLIEAARADLKGKPAR